MGVFYPLTSVHQEALKNFNNGNFSLWYNKYIPLTNDEKYKPSNIKGNPNEAIPYYLTQFNSLKKNAEDLLKKKHINQILFCKYYSQLQDFKSITIRAKLIFPLITGIGQSHPAEISMVFDRNIGIPYIPSSSIKGIVRFAHILSLILDENGNIKEEFKQKDEIDLSKFDIPDIFGGDKLDDIDKRTYSYKGKVVFLDVYPLNVPELKIDIMNPHYGEYYQDKEGKTPPADYLTPVPIKFLTVKEGEEFIFRFVSKKEFSEKAFNALKRAITQEGVGAKTSLGYGLFEVIAENEPEFF